MNKTLILSLALLLGSCASAPKITGGPAPDFYLSDQNGKVWSTQAMQEDTILIDFWATWCVPCLQAVPDLNAFNEKHGDKLKLLGVAIEEKGWEVVKPSMEKHGIKYPVAIGGANLAKAYQVEGIPMMVVIQKGKVIKQMQGKHTLVELEVELAEYLK